MPLPYFISLLLLMQEATVEKAKLSGIVLHSVTGAPLGKVELSLEPAEGQSIHAATTTTDASGKFMLVDLVPGAYHLRGQRSGFREMNYGARRPKGEGTVLRLESGEGVKDIVFQLMPAAVISGIVREADGEPVESAHVVMGRHSYGYGKPQMEGINSTDTDDQGRYRFGSLDPGKYYIGAEPRLRMLDSVDHSPRPAKDKPTEILIPTFYPGVSDASLASPIEVSAGAYMSGIDLTLRRARTYRLSGRLVNPPRPGRQIIQLLDHKNAGLRDFNAGTPTVTQMGDFEFREVPAGSYVLVSGTSRLPVEVSSSDIDNIRLVVTPGPELKGQVKVEGQELPDISAIYVFLSAIGQRGSRERLKPDGSLLFQNLPPGRYDMTLLHIPNGLYLKSIRSGETDIHADGLDLGSSIETAITLASDGAELSGTIVDKDQKSIAGATVLLAPNNRQRRDQFRYTTSDQRGEFKFAAIFPGEYKLFSFDEVEPESWHDPDVLKSHESRVELLTLEPKAKAVVSFRLK